MRQSPRPRRTLRGGAILLCTATVLLSAPGTATAQVSTSDPVEAAAGWLSRQLVDGDHIQTTFGDQSFPDYGLTADAVIAFAASGVAGDFTAAASDYLAANVEFYVGSPDTDVNGDGVPDDEYYTGALAKTILVAEVTGNDPTDFGGLDLVARLLSTEGPDGRFSDVSVFGDFSNNIGQSLAVLVLTRLDTGQLSAEADAFLASQRCSDGGPNDGNVPLSIGADACAPESISIDTTGFAIQALLIAGLGADADAGVSFLTGQQADDGGFSDLGEANSNSTGLAAQALRVGGADAAADAAAAWLADRQLACATPPEQRGAIAFTDDAGTPVYDDRAVRATTQAIPGLAGVGLALADAAGSDPEAPVLDCSAPSPSPTSAPAPTSAPPSASTPAASPAPELAETGVSTGPLVGLGVFSLILGTAFVVLARRRPGAHR